MKLTKQLLSLFLSSIVLFGCSYDDTDIWSEIDKMKSGETHLYFDNGENAPDFTFYPGEQKQLQFKSANIESLEVVEQPEGWTVNVVTEENHVDVTAATQLSESTQKIVLRGLDNNGLVFMAIAHVSYEKIDFKNRMGVFVLNEGSASGENGSLIYLLPGKYAVGQVYYHLNGRAPGNITQDLHIKDGKMYIIAQNREASTDGRLLVVDAATMKKIANYDEELSSLVMPTHVAVLNEKNIFIRDNNGVYHFDSTTKQLTFIEGSDEAMKNTMAVADNKVFVPASNKVLVLEADKHQIAHTIDMKDRVSGVLKTKDGNIWVSTTGNPQKISKVNSKDYSIIRSNEISEGTVSASFAATPGITAKGDTLYHGGLKTKIYRHIFSTGETKLMVDAKEVTDDAKVVYNTIAVHPVTGKVYMNTLKGFGQKYKTNSIIEFDFSGDKPEITGTYKDLTRFPAGIFFNANFN